MVIKILTKVKRKMYEQGETFNKDMENIKSII